MKSYKSISFLQFSTEKHLKIYYIFKKNSNTYTKNYRFGNYRLPNFDARFSVITVFLIFGKFATLNYEPSEKSIYFDFIRQTPKSVMESLEW